MPTPPTFTHASASAGPYAHTSAHTNATFATQDSAHAITNASAYGRGGARGNG